METTLVKSNNNFTLEGASSFRRGISCEFNRSRTSHLIKFGIFLIPFFGMCYKTYELIKAPEAIKEIVETSKSNEATNRKLKSYVKELQISDLFFGLAALVEIAATFVCGGLAVVIIPFLIYTVFVKTGLLAVNKTGLEDGYHTIKNSKIELPKVRVQKSNGRLTGSDIARVAIYSVLYCVPLLGVQLKRDLSIQHRAEYLSEYITPHRRAHLEKIQKIHDRCFFVAKAISLTLIMMIASLAIAHPFVLLSFGAFLITQSYFAGKIDMQEIFIGHVPDWRVNAISLRSYEMQEL